jgi:hypothetical protein
MKEDRKQHEGNQEVMQKIEGELKNLRNYRRAFELVLCDQ